MLSDIPSSEIVLIDPAKLLAAARTLREGHGYEQPEEMIADALFRWLEQEVGDLVNNLATQLTDSYVDQERFECILEDLAARRGVEVVT